MLLLNYKRVMDRQHGNVFLITQLNNLEAYAAFLVGNGLMGFCMTVVGYLCGASAISLQAYGLGSSH